MFDKSNLPSHLWARILWVPQEGSDRGDLPIAYVIERRRGVVGGGLVVLMFLAVLALVLVHAPALLAVPLVGVSFIALTYTRRGQAGYYEVTPDGRLGDYLGRKRPELSWMRLARIR